MTDTCPEGHWLRNGPRLLSRCYVCDLQLARAELYASGATYWADRDAAAGILPARQYIPEARTAAGVRTGADVSIYYQDAGITLHHGDAAAVLAGLEPGSVDCCVTSPPYFGLRDYGVDGQIGAEKSPAEFVAALVAVFEQVRRVLADDGTCWVNLGDSFAQSSTASGTAAVSKSLGIRANGTDSLGDAGRARAQARQRTTVSRPLAPDVPAKNLLGMPWRLAFALQDAGWYLRNAIVWNKPNAMPESVTDRLSTRYELIFLLTKSRRYHFDLGPIREPVQENNTGHVFGGARKAAALLTGSSSRRTGGTYEPTGAGRNPGDVWEIPTVPFSASHFAVFPPEIPRRAILAGCKPCGTVLDPFHGSGTTGMVAQKLGRRYVGIDLNSDYLDLSLRTRLADAALPFTEDAS